MQKNLVRSQNGQHEIVVALATSETRRLVTLEKTIKSGLATFHKVGLALLEIRDSRLYRASHDSFETYCRDRWKFTRQHAYHLIADSKTAQNVNELVGAPLVKESHARELTGLPASLQVQVWQQATSEDKDPTAERLRWLVEKARKNVRAADELAGQSPEEKKEAVQRHRVEDLADYEAGKEAREDGHCCKQLNKVRRVAVRRPAIKAHACDLIDQLIRLFHGTPPIQFAEDSSP